VIIISKAILSATTAQHVRELVSGLDSAPLWDLALELATQPGLRVSVITYQDGSTELEVLAADPPRHDERTIDCRRFTRTDRLGQSRILPAAGQYGLHDAVDMIQAIMRDVSSP
jgi:hypothetical protein